MAKNRKKPAKRVFFVSRNMDEIGGLLQMYLDPKDSTDVLWGEFYGARGTDPSVCEGRSRAWVSGWEIGREAYTEAVERFEAAREAGRKSAEVREHRKGTSQPTGGKGYRTENRTTDRTENGRGFGELSEGRSDNGAGNDDPDDEHHGSSDRIRQNRQNGTDDPNVDPKGVRISTERSTELASTHYPLPRNQDDPLNMNLRGFAHTRDEQNTERRATDEDPDFVPGSSLNRIPGQGFRFDRKISSLPPRLSTRPLHPPGMRSVA